MLPIFKRNNKNLRLKKKDIMLIAFLIFSISYSLYHILNKDNGFLKLRSLRKELKEVQHKYALIEEQSLKIKQEIAKVHPDHFDVDYIDELAREEYGMIGKNEKVIIHSE